MKNHINAMEYLNQINKALPRGILLTTAAEGKVNTMIIGWGHMGIEWGRPVFVAYVRKSRYTTQMLEKNGEFTINVPVDELDPEIIRVCGRKSGREMDKIAELGLTTVEGEQVNVPAIRQLPLTLECKVLFTQEQDASQLPQDIQERYYPGCPQDLHVAYYGQIVDAYILEED